MTFKHRGRTTPVQPAATEGAAWRTYRPEPPSLTVSLPLRRRGVVIGRLCVVETGCVYMRDPKRAKLKPLALLPFRTPRLLREACDALLDGQDWRAAVAALDGGEVSG